MRDHEIHVICCGHAVAPYVIDAPRDNVVIFESQNSHPIVSFYPKADSSPNSSLLNGQKDSHELYEKEFWIPKFASNQPTHSSALSMKIPTQEDALGFPKDEPSVLHFI